MALKIAVVVGSLRRDSFNKQLAHALVSLAPSDFSFEFLDIGTLPLYSQDYDSDFPEVARAFKQKIADANGLLIVTSCCSSSSISTVFIRIRASSSTARTRRRDASSGEADTS